jgi:hypothetical protein
MHDAQDWMGLATLHQDPQTRDHVLLHIERSVAER